MKEIPSKGQRPHLVLAVLVVAVVLAVAGVVTYVVSRPPALIDLKVTDGSTVGSIEGNLTSISSFNPLSDFFNATTYANQTGHPSSNLVLQVQTYSYYVGAASGGYLVTDIAVEVLGRFASNLHLSGLQLTANATGALGNSLYFWARNQTGANVTFDPNQHFAVFGTGSGQTMATPVNEGGVSYYNFAYGGVFEAREYLVHSQSVGFRVAVEGPFTPSVDVGILLEIINA